MEGTVISSLTIAPQKQKSKDTIRIKNPNKVMELGYVEFSVDMKSVEKALKLPESVDELDQYIEVETIEETIPARLKINKKRSTSIDAANVVEILDNPMEQQAA